MFESGDVWGLGAAGDWVGVSDGGGGPKRDPRCACFLLRNPLKNEFQQKIIDSSKNEIPSNFI